MKTEPLIGAEAPTAVVAYRDGQAISRLQYIADAQALAARLPAVGSMLNLTVDRYLFAVGLGAALLRGHASLLPPNHTLHTVERLRAAFQSVYALVESDEEGHGLPVVTHAGHVPIPDTPAVPLIAADRVAAYVLTSGSTGDPVPHAKPWQLLTASARAESASLGRAIGRQTLAGVSLVATVPPQHMYGFESSVLLALQGGAAFDASRPFYPADIVAALARVPPPRMLVTTPFHLKTLLESKVSLPEVDLVLCATAPLSPQLAARAESAFGAPLMEIYGCTEAGQVASRRTTAGPDWRTFDGLSLHGDGDAVVVSGGHVPQVTPLADVLEVIDAHSFRLLGRSNDLVNVAGKRSSIGHLNFHLNAIEGVVDGTFWMPPDDAEAPGVARLLAFVVAPHVAPERIRSALRARIDAAFLPRRIVLLDALPREATGKLTSARLAALAATHRTGGEESR
ncbi:MAG: AMP-binding protein [Pseudomonadota bacterium]|nr:AMP-binding protein [Pseudomonadota bacterium]